MSSPILQLPDAQLRPLLASYEAAVRTRRLYTLAGLVALARSRKKELSYASSGTGKSRSRHASWIDRVMADVESINVPSQSKTIRSKRCCGIGIEALESVKEVGALGGQRSTKRDDFAALWVR